MIPKLVKPPARDLCPRNTLRCLPFLKPNFKIGTLKRTHISSSTLRKVKIPHQLLKTISADQHTEMVKGGKDKKEDTMTEDTMTEDMMTEDTGEDTETGTIKDVTITKITGHVTGGHRVTTEATTTGIKGSGTSNVAVAKTAVGHEVALVWMETMTTQRIYRGRETS